MELEAVRYLELARPSWAPPTWLFGPVWTVLYAVIAVTYAAALYAVVKGRLPRRTAVPFLLNLVFNGAFTWIQFGLQNNVLAFIDILLVLGTLVWAMAATRKRMPWVAYANVPYLLWVSFATVLQGTITWMNR